MNLKTYFLRNNLREIIYYTLIILTFGLPVIIGYLNLKDAFTGHPDDIGKLVFGIFAVLVSTSSLCFNCARNTEKRNAFDYMRLNRAGEKSFLSAILFMIASFLFIISPKLDEFLERITEFMRSIYFFHTPIF
jgi:hypothetical protein